MNKIKLDKEEQEILEAYESGEFQSVMTAERKKSIEASAAQLSKKDKRINIRLSGRDLEEGMPYQTLVQECINIYQQIRSKNLVIPAVF